MKTLIFHAFVLFLSACLTFSLGLPENFQIQGQPAPVQSRFFQENNINSVVSSDGIFNLDRITFTTAEAGLIWPVTSASRRTMDFATSIWVGAKVGTQRELRLSAALYSSHYSPGNIPVIGQVPPSSVCADPSWKIYQVQLTDPSLVTGGNRTKIAGGRTYNIIYDSWANWPVDKGAPYVEVNGIPGYQPSFEGDRPGIGHTTARPDNIIFTVFMDYTNCTNNIHTSGISLPGGTLPLGVEIHFLSFTFFNPGFQNIYFTKWRITNKSSLNWDSVYVGLVDDADIGDGFDDAAGCDSTRNLGFIYNADNDDPIYGSAPPALGYRLLQTPLKFTGNNNDTAKLPYGNFVGYTLTGMSGYNIFTNGGGACTGDPGNAPAAYNFLRGKDGCGNTLINWVTGNPTKYKYSGNAVIRTGWYDSSGNDRRQILSCGPFTMEPGQEQYLFSGALIDKGSTNTNSVAALLSLSDQAAAFYNSSFGGTPIGLHSISSEVPKKYSLSQNYPNPFNPVTKLRFELPKSGFIKLTVFDITGKEIEVLANELLNPGQFEVVWDASKYSSGVYFYTLETADFYETKKMLMIK